VLVQVQVLDYSGPTSLRFCLRKFLWTRFSPCVTFAVFLFISDVRAPVPVHLWLDSTITNNQHPTLHNPCIILHLTVLIHSTYKTKQFYKVRHRTINVLVIRQRLKLRRVFRICLTNSTQSHNSNTQTSTKCCNISSTYLHHEHRSYIMRLISQPPPHRPCQKFQTRGLTVC